MKLRITPEFHSWAQTIAVIVSTALAIVALYFGVEGNFESRKQSNNSEIRQLWSSYLSEMNEFVEKAEDASNANNLGKRGTVKFKLDVEFYNLVQKLDLIDSITDDPLWQRRIDYELFVFGAFFCSQPTWSNSFRASASPKFLLKLEKQLSKCESGGR